MCVRTNIKTKPAPFRCVTWDLILDRICTVVNGERQIIFLILLDIYYMSDVNFKDTFK